MARPFHYKWLPPASSLSPGAIAERSAEGLCNLGTSLLVVPFCIPSSDSTAGYNAMRGCRALGDRFSHARMRAHHARRAT